MREEERERERKRERKREEERERERKREEERGRERGSEDDYLSITGTDSVITFGWNEHGICGTGDEANVHVPFPISKPLEGWKVRLIGTGAGHSLVLASTTYILYYSRQNNKQ